MRPRHVGEVYWSSARALRPRLLPVADLPNGHIWEGRAGRVCVGREKRRGTEGRERATSAIGADVASIIKISISDFLSPRSAALPLIQRFNAKAISFYAIRNKWRKFHRSRYTERTEYFEGSAIEIDLFTLKL